MQNGFVELVMQWMVGMASVQYVNNEENYLVQQWEELNVKKGSMYGDDD